MILRRFLLLVVWATLTAIVSVGCSRSEPNSADANASQENDRPTIALVMKSLANEFFSTMERGAREHQAKHSDQYKLITNGIKDERDLSRQVALVEEMVNAGADAIVIAPADSKALVPALRRAVESGVVVVNIDNKLDEQVLEDQGIDVPFVGPDNKAGAKKVGAYLAERLAAGDPVAILEGIPTSFNAQQRKAGFEEAISEAGLKLVDSQSADWEMTRANTIASAILSEHPEIKAILAANDSMALGALAAIKSAGREDDVMIVGFDNISAVQQAIREGKILATVDQYGDQLAAFGIEAALAQLQNPETELQDIETPVDLVTAETLSQ